MLDLTTSTRLDLAGSAGQDILQAYRTRINNALDTHFLTDTVTACIRSCFLGNLHAIHAVISPRRPERTAALIARDRHDGISVQLALAGTSRGQAGDRRVASDPGTVKILDFSQPFYMVDAGERDVINIAVPRTVLARHVPDPHLLHGVVLAGDEAAFLAGLLRGLVPQLESMPDHAGPIIAQALIDLLLLALGHDPRKPRQPPSDRRRRLIRHAHRLIDARPGSVELSPEWLAARLNVSRSALYGLFEEAGGVARFIWHRRLTAAQAALTDPADLRRIGEIAFAHGFSSEAHFSRAYRKAFGMTASATRRTRAAV